MNVTAVVVQVTERVGGEYDVAWERTLASVNYPNVPIISLTPTNHLCFMIPTPEKIRRTLLTYG